MLWGSATEQLCLGAAVLTADLVFLLVRSAVRKGYLWFPKPLLDDCGLYRSAQNVLAWVFVAIGSVYVLSGLTSLLLGR